MCLDFEKLSAKENLSVIERFSVNLALTPLLRFSRLHEARLLALLDARVALEELGGLEDLAGPWLCLDERTGDGVAERVGLGRDAAALHVGSDGVVLGALGSGERLLGDLGAQVSLEIVLHALTVDHNARLGRGAHAHARDGGLTASDCSDVSRFHFYEIKYE